MCTSFKILFYMMISLFYLYFRCANFSETKIYTSWIKYLYFPMKPFISQVASLLMRCVLRGSENLHFLKLTIVLPFQRLEFKCLSWKWVILFNTVFVTFALLKINFCNSLRQSQCVILKLIVNTSRSHWLYFLKLNTYNSRCLCSIDDYILMIFFFTSLSSTSCTF
jgi:hypothetical protein